MYCILGQKRVFALLTKNRSNVGMIQINLSFSYFSNHFVIHIMLKFSTPEDF